MSGQAGRVTHALPDSRVPPRSIGSAARPPGFAAGHGPFPDLRAMADAATSDSRSGGDSASPARSPSPPSAPPLSEADRKRLRHRAYVKKSYNKKLSTLASLRKELERLELQYADLLGERGGDDAADANAATTSPELQRYMAVTELKNRFRAENERLYAANAGFMKAEGRLGQLLDAEAGAQVPTPRRFRVRPLPEAEYAAELAAARDDVLRFIHGPDKLSTGARVFGWTDQRQIRGAELKFGLEKLFHGLSSRELLSRSWDIFSRPERFARIYGSHLDVRFHELQRVNDDTMLFYREIRSPAVDRVVKTVFLLARLRVDQGYMLLFRSIDKDRVKFQENTGDGSQMAELFNPMREAWAEKYIWVLFHDRGPDSCLFHFGGATTTTLWLKEVLFIALRWETMAVGPLFTITSS